MRPVCSRQWPLGPAGEQDHRGNRAGSAHQGHGERESGEIVDVVDRHRVGRKFFLSLTTLGEDHLESRVEEQSPPAMRNAGREMPSAAMTVAPPSAKMKE